MIMAGALEREMGEPQPSMQISKMQVTPAAESTRIPLRTSTEEGKAFDLRAIIGLGTVCTI